MRTAALLVALLLAGCATPPAPTPEPSPIYHPSLPTGVQMRDVSWVVLNREQIMALLAQADKSGEALVLFALTPQGFENLSLNMQELKRYILEEQEIILYYRKNAGTEHNKSKDGGT